MHLTTRAFLAMASGVLAMVLGSYHRAGEMHLTSQNLDLWVIVLGSSFGASLMAQRRNVNRLLHTTFVVGVSFLSVTTWLSIDKFAHNGPLNALKGLILLLPVTAAIGTPYLIYFFVTALVVDSIFCRCTS